MKRIIKFRGKDIKTGDFVFGDLETRPREDFMVIHNTMMMGAIGVR